jgi:protein CpxP
MKRFTLSVVITAVLGLAAYSLADAQGDRRGPPFGGPGLFQDGPGAGRQGRAHGPRGGGLMFGLRGLDLTDEQRTQIRAIHEAERGGAGSVAGGRSGVPVDAALRRELQTQLFADAPDAQKIAALQQELVQAHSARLARQIALEQKIAQVLTAEQRAQVREGLGQRGWRDPGIQ